MQASERLGLRRAEISVVPRERFDNNIEQTRVHELRVLATGPRRAAVPRSTFMASVQESAAVVPLLRCRKSSDAAIARSACVVVALSRARGGDVAQGIPPPEVKAQPLQRPRSSSPPAGCVTKSLE
ncbi:unnamed protein product [Lampetra fluviatilis]